MNAESVDSMAERHPFEAEAIFLMVNVVREDSGQPGGAFNGPQMTKIVNRLDC